MRDLLTPKFMIPVFIIAIMYLVMTTYLMNGKLVVDTISRSFPIGYKIELLLALLQGMWTAMSGIGLTILVFVSLLTGANLTLLVSKIADLRKLGNLKLTVGGGTLLGIAGSGCATCGLPVLALLGLSGSIAYLPFRGVEVSLIAIILLSLSLYFMLRSNSQKMTCNINITTAK